MSAPWPKEGRCGACGLPAVQFPSGTWKHVAGPCRARSQVMWAINDAHIKQACRFVPAGEALPSEPDRPYVHSETGETVREYLARTAEDNRVTEAPLRCPPRTVDVELPADPRVEDNMGDGPYRAGNHSPINVWHDPDGEYASSEQVCMATSAEWAGKIVDALNARPVFGSEGGQDRPRVVCLSGSMRFFDQILTVAAEETAASAVVLAPFSVVLPEDQGSDLKRMLDTLHLRKIDMSDEVVVVTVDGYIGESTRREIEYAENAGKPVLYREFRSVEPIPVVDSELRDRIARALHDTQCFNTEEHQRADIERLRAELDAMKAKAAMKWQWMTAPISEVQHLAPEAWDGRRVESFCGETASTTWREPKADDQFCASCALGDNKQPDTEPRHVDIDIREHVVTGEAIAENPEWAHTAFVMADDVRTIIREWCAANGIPVDTEATEQAYGPVDKIIYRAVVRCADMDDVSVDTCSADQLDRYRDYVTATLGELPMHLLGQLGQPPLTAFNFPRDSSKINQNLEQAPICGDSQHRHNGPCALYGAEAEAPREPRVWSVSDDEPDNITTVITPSGAVFNRGDDFRWRSDSVMNGYWFHWSDLVGGYPFVTEVIEGGAS